VRQAVLELGLGQVEVVQSRLEAYRPARKFVTIVARALASLQELYQGALNLAEVDGRLLALKGRLAEQELAALVAWPSADYPAATATRADAAPPAPSAQRAKPRIHPLIVPNVDGERYLIEVPLGGTLYG
jgi:hypothetical protein